MATGPGEWEQEVVRLGQAQGVTVLRGFSSGGQVVFSAQDDGVLGGDVVASVYKARNPDVVLENVAVYLVQRLAPTWQPGQPYVTVDEYAVMVDDPYWGRRIQGSEFREAPFGETFVMGYRVKGRILHNGVPAAEANVSLEGRIEGPFGSAIFWDSQEYNELIWSLELETYVEGSRVLAPIMTDAEGRWSFICPKGHGAIYQRAQDRRDGSALTAQEELPRRLTRLEAVYRGRRAELAEDVEAVIDVESGRLVVHGEPGAWVKVGTLDETGTSYLIQQDGTATVEGLPRGTHGVVQFKLNGWGDWDSSWGCGRATVEVTEGATATVDLGMMDYYDPGGNVVCGRVYERMGVPAVGVAIVPINFESMVVGDPIATTGGDGYWEAEIPEEGLGGDPWVHGAWGSVPLLGYPYSDVVLGARAYAGFAEMYKPEAWRKGSRGHCNFQYVQDEVWVEDCDTGSQYATVEAAHGGWVTEQTLPKYKYVEGLEALAASGPVLRRYSLQTPQEVLQAEFVLESQPFEAYETLTGQYRAAGYSPEAKFLLGGKVHGSVVTGDEVEIGLSLPEAFRVGLEFGEYQWFTQVMTAGGAGMAGFGDLLCPYCGGPTWRDPSAFGLVRGHCMQCAEMFGIGEAMDGRTHLRLPTTAATAGMGLEALVVGRQGGSRRYETRGHWRPDLYEENGDYLTQGGQGQATNAPRWFERHVNEVGDGNGFGRFEAGASPPFAAGHDLAWFGQLPEVGRNLGLAQMKLVLPYGYVQAEDVSVELDCRRGDGSIETVVVEIAAGTSGPNAEKPLSDLVRVKRAGKWKAEKREAPYAGAALYDAVIGARLLTAGADCRFTIINDVPLLASATGVPVEERRATPVAWQLGTSSASGPHLCDDETGQIFLFHAQDGEVRMWRRSGLAAPWQAPRAVTSNGGNSEPCGEKDRAGRLVLVWQHEADVMSAVSSDDGESWGEV